VIETLLDEDAVRPAAGALSDRGMRRLFDRLVALGGVRELTGTNDLPALWALAHV
jgi:hypothetical protein